MTSTWLALAMLVSTAHAEPCRTTAIVRGSPRLRDQLAARGLETTQREGCPATVVDVSTSEGGLLLAIRDASGRTQVTRVADLATAVSVVESWARPELEGALLASRPTPPVAAPDPDLPSVLIRRVAVRDPRTVRVELGPESALGSDHSLWFSVAGRACVRLGATCTGVLARLSQDSEAFGDSEAMQTARRAFDLGLVVDLPRDHAGWSWAAGAFLGLAMAQSRSAPESATATSRIAELDGGVLRGGAHVGISTALGERWFLGADLALELALLAPTDAPDPGAAQLAGPPRGFLRGALELRYEGL